MFKSINLLFLALLFVALCLQANAVRMEDYIEETEAPCEDSEIVEPETDSADYLQTDDEIIDEIESDDYAPSYVEEVEEVTEDGDYPEESVADVIEEYPEESVASVEEYDYPIDEVEESEYPESDCEYPTPAPTTIAPIPTPAPTTPQCGAYTLEEGETADSLIERVCGAPSEPCQTDDGVFPFARNADGVQCPGDILVKAGDVLDVCCAIRETIEEPCESDEHQEEYEEDVEEQEEGQDYAEATYNNAAALGSGFTTTETALAATGAIAGVMAIAGTAIYFRRRSAQHAPTVNTPAENII